MKIVSPLLKRVVYPALASAGVFRRTSAPGLAIVTYHGVMPPGYEAVDAAFDGNLIGADMLRRQLRLLKTHYNVVSPEDLLAWRQGNFQLPPRAVLLTCDDGLLNCLTDMLPVLQEERVKCLFFVTGASAGEERVMLWYEELFLAILRAPGGSFEISFEGIDLRGELGSRAQRRALWWSAVKKLSGIDAQRRKAFLRYTHEQLGSATVRDLDQRGSTACRRYGLLTCNELRQLASAEMAIGAHTMSHPMLSQMPSDLAYAEISESRAALESALQTQVWGFAYPFGHEQSITPEILAMPQKSGFDMAFVNFGGGLGVDLPAYALPRIHVTAEVSLPEFEAHISGFYARLQRRARRTLQTIESVRAA